ncbi:beta-galactosidase [Paenibacillus sp. IB182496]|uniref:Beta-galactosidase n=1 Tax=Paenibacillus sabuli TaxID=2772509 RepID=A0A927BQH3_9BACL|nr:beta-galactosidase [Paenibacillus sabuli]MBD2844071.1 beta-galactosidase [Paenibacillus sabuli]
MTTRSTAHTNSIPTAGPATGPIAFYDPAFPYAGTRPDEAALARLGERMRIVDADALARALTEALQSGEPHCLVQLHGPYFPLEAWPALLTYLQAGGGLVHAGGAPYRIPVARTADGWTPQDETTAYHQRLGIHEALAVDPAPIARLRANADIPLLTGLEALLPIAPARGLVLHATHARDIPAESGANGPMDMQIQPLLYGISADGREVAAPAVLLDNTKGDCAGGRWLLVTQTLGPRFWCAQGVEALADWAACCARGVLELWVKPGYASYLPGERATLQLQAQRIPRARLPRAAVPETVHCRLEVYKDGTEGALWTHELELAAEAELSLCAVPVPLDIEPGLYRLVCTAAAPGGERRVYRQGWWGFDAARLRRGAPLARGRDYFHRDGQPLPIVGMTYMTSDVSRKFVFLPNAPLWERDMRTMKGAGINLIRTGLWTAWRQVMFTDGHASEEAMRAIDAFLLTAASLELEVTFTFFAFTPEAWEGANPYLDRRSVEAQKRFIAAIVSRHAASTHVHWDLINEPSLFDPQRIFTGPRPLHDAGELEAYAQWLRERHGSIEALRASWMMTADELPSFAAARPPEREEISFDIENMRLPRKHNRWLDYTLFTMAMHNRWAAELGALIRKLAPDRLVTVGQDEALGRGPRPSPLWYAEAVDYTTVHTWWLNDQLVWDSVFAKAPDKPCLVQETGIMYLETPDGRAKRTEGELRDILERKYAYAFATGGAGAVQWIWNTNYYMNNVNESNIGALRADGTEKPEADVSYDFGAFMAQIAPLFADRALEEIAVVYPYSNDFSSRSLAFDATTAAARVLGYELKQPFRAFGEYHLEALAEQPPRLIVVPSPHNFGDAALEALLRHVREHGGTLLVTGPLGLDAYWRSRARLAELTGERRVVNVLREETLLLEGRRHPVSYARKRIGEASKDAYLAASGEADAAVRTDGAWGTDGDGQMVDVGQRSGAAEAEAELRAWPLGAGTLLHCPLPIELSERTATIAAVYDYAIRQAGVTRTMVWHSGGELPGVYGSQLLLRGGQLYTFVSEYAHDARIEVGHPAVGRRYVFTLPRGRCVLFATDEAGEVIASYRELDIEARAAEQVQAPGEAT